MNDSKISVRYARAIFESALEAGKLEQVRKDMEYLEEVSMLPEFRFMVVSPVMKPSEKEKLVTGILKDNVLPLTVSFVKLLMQNGREEFIRDIARNFGDMYRKHLGIKSATFTSAEPVSEVVISKIKKLVAKAAGSEVELAVEDNPDLIGGFVLQIEDQQYDASVSNSLKKVKKQLIK